VFTSVQPPPQPQLQPADESSAKAILWKAILGKAKDMEANKKLAETKVDAKRTIYRHGLRDMANLKDSYNLMYAPKIWTAADERNLNLTVESAEVSKLVPSRTAPHSVMPR
jgi:hypothetical protein